MEPGEESPPPEQAPLALAGAAETSAEEADAPAAAAPREPSEPEPTCEPPLEAVVPAAGAVVQHVGSWLLLCLLERLGVYALAAQQRGKVAMASLRPAIDAAAIALALGEGCIEGVRRITTLSVGTLLRRAGGISASWVRRALHEFADVASETLPGLVATRLLARAGEGEDRVWLHVDNHLRPYTGKHVIARAGACRTSVPCLGRPSTTCTTRRGVRSSGSPRPRTTRCARGSCPWWSSRTWRSARR
jgi:hypothetical protein